MFGNNSITGAKFFKDCGDKLLVTSIFYTLSGEGPYSGMPAIFIRFSRCNLQCDFCDTWFDSGTWMSIEDIKRAIDIEIQKYFHNNIPEWAQHKKFHWYKQMVLVITGGEPTLQNKNLQSLLFALRDEFRFTQIETNGILEPLVPSDTTVVTSPKCVNGKYMEISDNVLHRTNFLKFVMCADKESQYSEIPEWALKWNKYGGKIFISPMNEYARQCGKTEISSFWTEGLVDMKKAKANHEYCAQYCLKHGLRYSMQQHLFGSMA
jgi:7-carboxy-7-deazaguanine synthase